MSSFEIMPLSSELLEAHAHCEEMSANGEDPVPYWQMVRQDYISGKGWRPLEFAGLIWRVKLERYRHEKEIESLLSGDGHA